MMPVVSTGTTNQCQAGTERTHLSSDYLRASTRAIQRNSSVYFCTYESKHPCQTVPHHLNQSVTAHPPTYPRLPLLRIRPPPSPGFARLSLPYFMPDEEVTFVLDALCFVATHGWKLLPLYRYDPSTAEWTHRSASHIVAPIDEFRMLAAAFRGAHGPLGGPHIAADLNPPTRTGFQVRYYY